MFEHYIVMRGTWYRRKGKELRYTQNLQKAKTFDTPPTLIPGNDHTPEERVIKLNELDVRDLQDAHGVLYDRVKRIIVRAEGLNKIE